MGVMSYETLKYEQDEHVVVLTYNRPQQHNAISRRMNAELHEAFQRWVDDTIAAARSAGTVPRLYQEEVPE